MQINKIENDLGLIARKNELVEKIYECVIHSGFTYTEAILEVCERYGIEPEDITPIITGSLKERLRLESIRRHSIIDSNQPMANRYIQDCT